MGTPDSGAIFEAYLNNSLRRFSEVNFSHFTSQVTLFFVENGSLKFSDSQNVRKRGIKKCFTFVISVKFHLKFSDNDTKPL